MLELKQSATDKVIPFLMVVSSNHIDGATGLTPAVEISKSGSAFAAPGGAIAGIAGGWVRQLDSGGHDAHALRSGRGDAGARLHAGRSGLPDAADVIASSHGSIHCRRLPERNPALYQFLHELRTGYGLFQRMSAWG